VNEQTAVSGSRPWSGHHRLGTGRARLQAHAEGGENAGYNRI